MPAALPGSTTAENLANPSAGRNVIFDALSGPKGSPFDAKKPNYLTGGAFVADPTNLSTGGMCTGIGFGCNAGTPINIAQKTTPATAAQALSNAGFTDDTGDGINASNSRFNYIGGGRSNIVGGVSTPVPYTAGFVPGNAGNGGSRDAGAGPAFTCFVGKWVTATGSVANGAVVETGFVNRCGKTIVATDSVFGSASAAQAAPA